MNSGLYICPGAPATCRAAVRAIWLARPGTRVSKVSSGLRRLRDGWTLAEERHRRRGSALRSGRRSVDEAPTCAAPLAARVRGADRRRAALPPPSRGASVTSSRTGLPASSLSTDSIRPAYWLRIQSSLKRFGHAHRDQRAVGALIGDFGGRQRADPGVELLFGQFGGEAFAAALPKVDAHCGEVLSKRLDCMPSRPGRTRVIHSFQRPASSRCRATRRAARPMVDATGPFRSKIVGSPKHAPRSPG